MICLRCGSQCNSFNYWCFNCSMELNEHTGANYNQIVEIKSLLTKCENLEELINGSSPTVSILADQINEMKKYLYSN